MSKRLSIEVDIRIEDGRKILHDSLEERMDRAVHKFITAMQEEGIPVANTASVYVTYDRRMTTVEFTVNPDETDAEAEADCPE